MSDQITTAFSKQYSAAVTLLAQQEMSRLRMCVATAPQVGEFQFHDQVGSTTARKRTVRHADSPYIPTPHSRKGVKMYDWDWGDYIDRQDQVKTLIDPTNPYTRAGGAALGRAMDSEIIAAFDGNAITDDGGTVVTFANDGGTTRSVSAGGLDQAEILGIREQFYANDVDDGEFYMAIASSQVTDLLNINQVGSVDYNALKPLVEGKVASWMGFNFVHVSDSLLPKSGTTRSIYAWEKSGMLLAEGIEMNARVVERSDKSFSTYVYNAMSIGSVRLEGKRVIKGQITE